MTKKEEILVNDEDQELAELLAEESIQAPKDAPKVQNAPSGLLTRVVPFGSPTHVTLVELGYGMTVDEAETIIDEYHKMPGRWPYDALKKARAMLAQINTVPVVVSPDKPWERFKGRVVG